MHCKSNDERRKACCRIAKGESITHKQDFSCKRKKSSLLRQVKPMCIFVGKSVVINAFGSLEFHFNFTL